MEIETKYSSETPIKMLWVYFGQPRMLEECIPWHDNFIKYLKEHNIHVDLSYNVWNQYYNKITEVINDCLVANDISSFEYIDENKVRESILNNRVEGCDVIQCNFLSYDIMHNLHEMYNDIPINKHLFFNAYAQNISKAVGARNIPDVNDYDLVYFVRTDLIFDPAKYPQTTKTFIKYYEQIRDESNNNKLLLLPWIHYHVEYGATGDDRCLLGQPKSLKEFFSDYEMKHYTYLKNVGTKFADPHHIVMNFGLYHYRGIANKTKLYERVGIRIRDQRKNIIHMVIARPLLKIKEKLKTVNQESYEIVVDLFKDYQLKVDQAKKIARQKMPNFKH